MATRMNGNTHEIQHMLGNWIMCGASKLWHILVFAGVYSRLEGEGNVSAVVLSAWLCHALIRRDRRYECGVRFRGMPHWPPRDRTFDMMMTANKTATANSIGWVR